MDLKHRERTVVVALAQEMGASAPHVPSNTPPGK
jgi:hypothetical protein